MIRTLTTLALAGAAFVGLTGCSYSEDRESYESTYISPKTVTLVDVSTNETIWTYAIPPQHILVLERETDGNIDLIKAPQGYATELYWALYPIGAPRSAFRQNHYWGAAIEEDRMALEGRPVKVVWTVGDSIDPSTIPTDRKIEDIEKDLPEPGQALPEPDAPAEEAPAEEAPAAE